MQPLSASIRLLRTLYFEPLLWLERSSENDPSLSLSISTHPPSQLHLSPGVLAAIPVSGCDGAGAGSHRYSPQLHHRAQLRPGPPGPPRLAALSVMGLAATAAVSYRAWREWTPATPESAQPRRTPLSLVTKFCGFLNHSINTGVWWELAEHCGHPQGQEPGVTRQGEEQCEGLRHAAQRRPLLLQHVPLQPPPRPAPGSRGRGSPRGDVPS